MRVKVSLIIILASLAFSFGVHALSQGEESDEARVAAEKAKHRKYPGGRDEQELTVQAALPQSTRNPEAPKVQTVPPPESDTDTHD